jgi:Flp pilus assembly protein TadG
VYKLTRNFHSLLASFVADRRGSPATEFALVALPFFAILFAIFQVGIVFLAENELETAAEIASRQLLTGQGQTAGVTASQFKSSICSNLPSIFDCSGVMVDLASTTTFAGANVDLTPPVLTYDANGNVTNTWNFQTGGTGSVLVLRVIYQFPVFLNLFGLNLADLPNGRHEMMTTLVFAVEPYNQTGS